MPVAGQAALAALKLPLGGGIRRQRRDHPALCRAEPDQPRRQHASTWTASAPLSPTTPLKYEATLRFINGQVRSMLDAMKSPQQG